MTHGCPYMILFKGSNICRDQRNMVSKVIVFLYLAIMVLLIDVMNQVHAISTETENMTNDIVNAHLINKRSCVRAYGACSGIPRCCCGICARLPRKKWGFCTC